jgi:hypothetical protein
MRRGAFLLALAWLILQPVSSAQGPLSEDETIVRFLDRLKQVVSAGDPAAFTALLAARADRAAAEQFAMEWIDPGVTRAVLLQRDRGILPAGPDGAERRRLMLDTMVEHGPRARLATWTLDISRTATDADWAIETQERITNVEGLYRLSLHPEKQFAARNLVVHAEDLTLRVASGSAFVAEADGRVTAIVLRGDGTMTFSPRPAAERGQLRIFSGAETLETNFDAAFIRVQPDEYETLFTTGALTPRRVDQDDFRRAEELFDEYLSNSYALDLKELSPHTWSLLPAYGDVYADIHTRRFGTLTYARSGNEAEDITLFDRKRKKNIALYMSEARLAARGPFYDEDEGVEYDVEDYDIDAAFQPDREWIEGTARLLLKTRMPSLATLTLRLSQYVTVRSVYSDRFGRLLHLRVKGQDTLILNFPTPLEKGTSLTLVISYGGVLSPQDADREAMQPGHAEVPPIPPEPHFIYSNRSYWYPQSTVTDYATARIKVTVPGEYVCLASGEPDAAGPVAVGGTRPGRQFKFTASQPVRYLSLVISRFNSLPATLVTMEDGARDAADETLVRITPGVYYDSVALGVAANPRQKERARQFSERAAAILRFYTSLIGDMPYPSFTLAVTESDLPGGHSPAYFAVLNQPVPGTPFNWRNDPVNFEGFSDFYLAHELAHQWWGQAVGWENYHEQWLSEGISQYFAALYARKDRGEELFGSVMRQMRRTAMSYSDQGPVHLGYRLGHIQGQGRIFRALVYNKAAVVLHMLRQLIGDEAFWKGLRRFYVESRFEKVGSEDLRRAFEAASGQSLERFFDRWIYGASVPTVGFSYAVETANATTPPRGEDASAGPDLPRPELVLRFEQGQEVFDLPLKVTLYYENGRSAEVVVPLSERISEKHIALAGPLRSVEINRDNTALAEIRRK